jgi:hypothetical protein
VRADPACQEHGALAELTCRGHTALALAEWYDNEAWAGTAKAAYLIDNILETGLEPFREPPTLAPIRLDEIELVCWMAISPI